VQFQRIGQWLPIEALRADPSVIAAGMVPVWQRGAAGSWMGHIGVTEGPATGTTFPTIQGNAGPTGGAVVRYNSDLLNPNLLGMGYFVDSKLQRSPGLGYLNAPTGISYFTPSAGATGASLQDIYASRVEPFTQ
jgi:hypothetical protein